MKKILHRTTFIGLCLAVSNHIFAAPFFTQVPTALSVKTELQASTIRNSNQSVRDAYIYTIDSEALTKHSESLELNITPELTVFANKLASSNSASGGLLWKGKISSSHRVEQLESDNTLLDNSVIMVNRNGNITGTIRANGRLFKVQPLDNGQHLVIEVDQLNMKPDHPPGTMEELEAQRQESMPQLLLQDNAVAMATPIIRVLVLYTRGVPAEVRDIPGLIDLAIAETNQGYSNSDVDAIVELAHLAPVNYTEVSISTDLNRLQRTNDGFMDDAHQLRDQYAADVVMLIVPNSGSACGKAAAIGARASTAFAVTAQDCATGYYSFGHEIGHLQSARHNPEADSSTTPYAFGHGYYYSPGSWRTVMSYNCPDGCTRINWWSNPNKTRNGVAMGTSYTSNNARVLNITSPNVAAFRSGGSAGNVLENGVPVSNLSASQGQDVTFTMDVPSGASNIQFSIRGGSGDADLYVKFGSAPSDGSYDCRPYDNGNSETCDMTDTGGVYYIRVKAYSTFSGVTLTGSYQ